jgi:hypothetical protein
VRALITPNSSPTDPNIDDAVLQQLIPQQRPVRQPIVFTCTLTIPLPAGRLLLLLLPVTSTAATRRLPRRRTRLVVPSAVRGIRLLVHVVVGALVEEPPSRAPSGGGGSAGDEWGGADGGEFVSPLFLRLSDGYVAVAAVGSVLGGGRGRGASLEFRESVCHSDNSMKKSLTGVTNF